MRNISYRRIEFDHDDAEKRYTVSLIEFVYNVVAITESGIIPPFDILNERFLSGGKCNPFGNVDWEPFEISRDEYDRLVDEIEALDPAEVWSHKGIKFVKLRRAKELDKFSDSHRWSLAVGKKYSDEYVANLMQLNPAESGGASGSQERSRPSSEQRDRPGDRREKPDLGRIRQALVELSSAAIERFASEHGDTRFYAFGFDLNAAYGNVLLCANTEADFQRAAQKYVENWNYTDADFAHLKSNFGDWRYQGFNLDYPDWDDGWTPHSESIETYVFAEDAGEEEVAGFLADLIRTCAFALLDLENSGVLNQLNQEPDFYIQCIDHDENEDEARERFERYRREYASNAGKT